MGSTHDPLDTEVIEIIEVDADDRLVRRVVFDIDDIDGAFTELDARYLAGEAATYARTWSALLDSFSALNRHELPSAPLGLVAIDHRQGPSIAPDELMKFLRAGWNLTPDFRMCIEAVHQLSDNGAVITMTAHGTSPEGFEADWRIVELLWKDGAGHRLEVFDETDLEAALARFEELHPDQRRLENTATRVESLLRRSFRITKLELCFRASSRGLLHRRSSADCKRWDPPWSQSRGRGFASGCRCRFCGGYGDGPRHPRRPAFFDPGSLFRRR